VTRSPWLEYLCLQAVRQNNLASTNEVARILNRNGANTGRNSVRNALRSLESQGALKNIGDGIDAWQALP
jgi:Fe2+ or Zn2+ uptake regulation protein